MNWFSQARRRLAVIFHPGSFDRDLAEEIQNHLDEQAEDLERDGLDAEAARSAAVRQLGNKTLLKEASREVWVWPWFETLFQDLRFAARTARCAPLFTALAIATLAMGIGLNTAIFSLMYDATMQSLPISHPEQLIQLTWTGRGGPGTTFNWPDYRPLLKPDPVLPGLFASLNWDANLRSGEATGRVRAQAVSGSYYATLGTGAAAGRVLRPEDDRPAAAPVAVLSYACWRGRFALDPAVLGRTVFLDGSPVMIVGVTPPEFYDLNRLSPPDITLPLDSAPLPEGKSHYVSLFARLGVGSSPAAAHAQVSARFAGLLDTELKSERWMRTVHPDVASAAAGDIAVTSGLQIPLSLLGACVGAVLLICCTNLGSLLLARAGVRSREIGVRLSLGAGRLRIVRQLLTESVALAGAGGAAGLFIAGSARQILTVWLIPASSSTLPFRLHWRLLMFTAAVSIAAALLFGLAPALRATRDDVAVALRGLASSGGVKFGRVGSTFLVFQVAASVVLLVIATMFIRSLRNLTHVAVGFDPDRFIIMTVDTRDSSFRDESIPALLDEIMDRVAGVPGVRTAAFAQMPLFGGSAVKNVWLEDHREDSDVVFYNLVGPGFFKTAGIPVLLGREFSPRDRDGTPGVAIVNESFARQYGTGRTPLGHRFGDEGRSSAARYEIIGVVKDSISRNLRQAPGPAVFQPLLQRVKHPPFVLHVRAAGDPVQTANVVRKIIKEIDAHVTVYNVQTISEKMNSTLGGERAFSLSTGMFGGLALALSCIGLYGITSYSVTRRTREIGIRVALGAERMDIMRLVLHQTLRLGCLGLLAGVLAALALAWTLRNFWFGISPTDPLSIAIVAGLLAATAGVACILPARRATRINPIHALHYE